MFFTKKLGRHKLWPVLSNLNCLLFKLCSLNEKLLSKNSNYFHVYRLSSYSSFCQKARKNLTFLCVARKCIYPKISEKILWPFPIGRLKFILPHNFFFA